MVCSIPLTDRALCLCLNLKNRYSKYILNFNKDKMIQTHSSAGIAQNPMLAEVHPIEGLLHLVVKNKGNIQIPKTLFPNSWQIDYIRAVYFDEEFDIEQDDKKSLKWNAYVGRIRSAIGVHAYCEWVRNKESNIVGILAFYNPKGEEIKVKHFKKWRELLKCVQLHFC